MKYCSHITRRFLLSAKHSEIASLQALAFNCRVVSAVRDTIHYLQRERGSSNIWLASAGQRFELRRNEEIALAQQAQQQLQVLLNNYLSDKHHGTSARLLNSITFALQGLDHLPELRERVSKLKITSSESTQAFSQLIAYLLAVIFEAADVANDAAISRQLIALFNFIQGKEFAGQERAWGAIGFTKTYFTKALCERLAQLQQVQQNHFSLFVQFASIHQQRLWQELVEHQAWQELEQLRAMIKKLDEGSAIDAGLSEIWFEIATARMDQMQGIEQAMTQELTNITQHKVIEAKQKLGDQQALIAAMEARQGPMNLCVSQLLEPHTQDLNTMEYGRAPDSFYDLLREQSRDIARMEEELVHAKQAIADQKKIDRAKLLIIQKFKFTEEQAFRELQKQAMSNNLKLVDVADKVIVGFK